MRFSLPQTYGGAQLATARSTTQADRRFMRRCYASDHRPINVRFPPVADVSTSVTIHFREVGSNDVHCVSCSCGGNSREGVRDRSGFVVQPK
jgi:hypothetical protein